MLNFEKETQLYVIQNKSLALSLAVLCGAALSSMYVGLDARAAGLGSLNTGLVALSALSGLVNAGLALLVFPLIFTPLSRWFGAASEVSEVRAINALSFVPIILGTLLSTLGAASLWAGVAGLASTAVFAYGLSLANGTGFLAGLRHTLAVWGVLLLIMMLLNGLFLAVRTWW